ncbi:phosphoribosylanthranilate isomerase [Methanoregula sp.]|uniref:phosphoribosylanthranilate isomerase n=1 Tax=Methanoregula sp. TaxID=2052170 RepID=UPI0023757089|nr:phosphoribosylanthranilate isomerase [Methanoregula sp.]MDD1687341.1 phosphoribosylanthranilate isomerase [Methanoregula sp.]
MRIKICGITRLDDARYAEKAGAHAIGVVLFSDSKRSVTPDRAREIFNAVGPFTATVAVTHTQSREELDEIIALHPSAIQIFHPFVFDRSPGPKIIRVIARGDPLPDDCAAVIVDESHGGGKLFDADHAKEAVKRSHVPVILAGGLTPANVGRAICEVHPYAVDVASGVEVSPGIKDHTKIEAFIAACRKF